MKLHDYFPTDWGEAPAKPSRPDIGAGGDNADRVHAHSTSTPSPAPTNDQLRSWEIMDLVDLLQLPSHNGVPVRNVEDIMGEHQLFAEPKQIDPSCRRDVQAELNRMANEQLRPVHEAYRRIISPDGITNCSPGRADALRYRPMTRQEIIRRAIHNIGLGVALGASASITMYVVFAAFRFVFG